MELNERIYELSVQANLDGQDIKVIVNGEDKGIKAKHVIKKIELETGRIRGFSILEFYTVKDGFLVDKEGNQIHFSTERFPEIKINRIKKPFIYSELDVDVQHISDVASLLNMEVIEDTLKELSPEEKKYISNNREARLAEREMEEARKKAKEDERLAEEARKAEEEAKTATEIKVAEEVTRLAEEEARKSEEAKNKAEKEAEEAKRAEEEARIQAEKSAEEAKKKEEEEKEYVLSEKEYEKLVRRNKKSGLGEYVKNDYHFFYGANLPKGEFPHILKKRKDNKYEELEGGIVDESESEVEFEFTDDGQDKTLILDIDNEDVTIENN